MDLGSDVYGYAINKVIRLDDGLYFCIQNESYHKWYYCKEDGTGFIQLLERENVETEIEDEHDNDD